MHSFARRLPAPGLFCLLGIFHADFQPDGSLCSSTSSSSCIKGLLLTTFESHRRLTEGCESRNLHASSEIHETDRSKGMKDTAFVSPAPRRQCHKGIDLSPKGPTFMHLAYV